jgi:hypothetical protein
LPQGLRKSVGDASVGKHAQALEAERRSRAVAQESFAALAIGGRNDDTSVQVKASICATASGGLRRNRRRIVVAFGLVALGERRELTEADRAFKASAQRRAVALFSAMRFADITQQIPPPKPGECSNGHVGGDVLEIGFVGGWQRVKGGGRIISREREDTIRNRNVIVDV